MAQADTGASASVSVRTVIEPLHRGKFWLQFIGVLSIIGGALQALGAIAFLIDGQVLGMIPGVIAAVLFVWIGLVLMGAAGEIDRGYRNDDSEAVSNGMARLKTYFTIIGVLALIGVVLMVLGLLAAVSMGIGGLMLV